MKEVFSINNKVFVQLIVPEIDQSYDVYLPINKKIVNIIILLNKAVSEMTSGELALSSTNSLYNASTKEKYASDVLLAHSNIRNGSVLVLIS